jgi:PKD repeat protein
VTLVQGGGLLGGILIPAGTAAGSYTGVLTLTNGVGCTLSRDIRVNINALPEVPKLLGGIGFCKGADMTLRTDGKGLLQWYKDGQELTGFNDSLLVIGKIGDYRVVTTNASGCVRSSELRKIVEHPVPVAGYGINDSLQCFNENRFVFSNGSKISTGDLLHVWSFGDSTYTTGVSPVHGYKGSGQYRVKLVSSSVYGCKDSVEKIVRVYDIPVKPQVNVVGSTSLCEGGLVYLLSTDALSYRWYRDGVKLGLDTSKVYRATAGGRYQLRVVNADGCESDYSDSVRVVVNPIPPVPEVTEVSLSYCISTNAVALKAKATSAKNTLLWYSPSSGDTAKVVVPVPSTVRSGRFDYYVSQRGDGGCESDKVRITVVVGSNGVKPSLNWDGGVLSTDTGYVSYEWLADGKVVEKGKSGMYRPKVAGLYRVLVTNLYGCVDTSGVYNLVVTAINNTAANSYVNMNIYPNPMRSKVTVDAGERPQKEYTIRVYDARGKTITTVLSKRQVTELNTSGMTSGQYMVEVSEGTKRKTMRVVKSE